MQSTTVNLRARGGPGLPQETAALGFPFRENDGLRAGRALLIGFVVSLATVLCLSISPAGGATQGDDPIVETSHASIESREGQALRVVFAAEGQPALIFKPSAEAWDWSATSKLVIPVDNSGDEPLTLLLRIENDPARSLSGKVAIAPHSSAISRSGSTRRRPGQWEWSPDHP